MLYSRKQNDPKKFKGTKLSIKVNDHVGKESFITNIGSPQGDGISGINFNIYFENALKEIRHKRQAFKEAQEMLNITIDEKHSIESIYADDTDFADTEPQQSKWIQENSTSILKEYNLPANPDKTEITILKRDAVKINEKWRTVKKLGSILGDEEDIIHRKILATAALSKLKKVWKTSAKISRILEKENSAS